MKIFIDHFPSSDDTATLIANQIKKIDNDLSVTTFLDIRENGFIPKDKEDERQFNEADILIPIVTSEFLSYSKTEIKYSEIVDTENKIIFPLIYNKTNWSSKNWVVKSKIFPSNNTVFEELNSNEQASVINELVRTIGNIISESKRFKLEKIFKSSLVILIKTI